MYYDNLVSIGITHPDNIDRYSLRQEGSYDILKIYFRKDNGEFYAKSVKFKFPRQRNHGADESMPLGYEGISQISPNLRYVIDELEIICQHQQEETDLRSKILNDLHHLKNVISNKIEEIEADLEKLYRNSR